MTAAFETKRPETPGINMLVDGSAARACMHWMQTWSDIIDHLPFLFQHARGNVVELGVRGGVSTAALLAGVEKHGGQMFSVDVDPACGAAFDGHPLWTFCPRSSLDRHLPTAIRAMLLVGGDGVAPDLTFIDLLFIDTEHTHEQLAAELALWAPLVKKGGMIAMHDVITFPDMGSAAGEFASARGVKYEVHAGSNGLGVLKF